MILTFVHSNLCPDTLEPYGQDHLISTGKTNIATCYRHFFFSLKLSFNFWFEFSACAALGRCGQNELLSWGPEILTLHTT